MCVNLQFVHKTDKGEELARIRAPASVNYGDTGKTAEVVLTAILADFTGLIAQDNLP